MRDTITAHRNLCANDGAEPGRARDRQQAARFGRAAAHGLETEMAVVVRRRLEPAAVVADLHDHAPRPAHDQDPGLARAGVLRGVGQRLAPDAEELDLGVVREREALAWA